MGWSSVLEVQGQHHRQLGTVHTVPEQPKFSDGPLDYHKVGAFVPTAQRRRSWCGCRVRSRATTNAATRGGVIWLGTTQVSNGVNQRYGTLNPNTWGCDLAWRLPMSQIEWTNGLELLNQTRRGVSWLGDYPSLKSSEPTVWNLMRTSIDTLWDPANNIGLLAQES